MKSLRMTGWTPVLVLKVVLFAMVGYAKTASTPTEVQIRAKADMVKNIAVRNFISDGWQPVSDSQFLLVFSRPQKGLVKSALTSAFLSPSACQNEQRVLLTLTLYELEGKTTVKATEELEYPGSFCRLQRMPLGGKKEIGSIMDELTGIKNAAETAIQATQPPPAQVIAQPTPVPPALQPAAPSPAPVPKTCISSITNSDGKETCLDRK